MPGQRLGVGNTNSFLVPSTHHLILTLRCIICGTETASLSIPRIRKEGSSNITDTHLHVLRNPICEQSMRSRLFPIDTSMCVLRNFEVLIKLAPFSVVSYIFFIASLKCMQIIKIFR